MAHSCRKNWMKNLLSCQLGALPPSALQKEPRIRGCLNVGSRRCPTSEYATVTIVFPSKLGNNFNNNPYLGNVGLSNGIKK